MSLATKAKLEQALGKLEAVRLAHEDQRQQVVARARQQLDSIHGPIAEWQRRVTDGGDVLAGRRLKVLCRERTRLQRIVSDHEERQRAQRQPEPL